MAEEQHIRIKAILEILGKPKEHIIATMNKYIDEIEKDDNLIIMDKQVADAKEQGEVWSVFAEIEIVIKGAANLIGFCMDYMPSSIEVIKPEKFEFEDRTFTAFVNDLLAKLHRVDMIAKKTNVENTFLKKNMNNLIENNILVLIKFGVNNIQGIVNATKIEESELKKYLEKLNKENRIKEDNAIYSIA
jgi:hypothetical protein